MPIINNRFYTNYSTFLTKRISANPENTAYRIGPEGTEVFTDDIPEILWQDYVLFDDNDRWWTMGKLHNKVGGGGGTGGECIMPDGSTAGIDVGGLASGTDVSGKSVTEVISDIISPEFAPVWKGASATWAAGTGYADKVCEIGETTPSAADITSHVTTAKASAKASASYTAYGGAASSVTATGKYATKMDAAGDYTIGYTAVFAAGTDVVKTNKGNATNKTASVANTLLSKGTVNTSIDATTCKIKQITVTGSATIHAVYPIFATTSAITTLTKQTLTTATTVTLAMPAETNSAKHSFQIPSAYTLTSVKVLNTLSGKYEDYPIANFRAMQTSVKLANLDSEVLYNTYKRSDGTNGATTFQITFSK